MTCQAFRKRLATLCTLVSDLIDFKSFSIFRQIWQLAKKKGTDEQKEKNKRKSDRFKQEINLIKTFLRNDVSKFSLLNTEKAVEEDYINPEGNVYKQKIVLPVAIIGILKSLILDIRSLSSLLFLYDVE